MHNPAGDTHTYQPKGKKLGELRRRFPRPTVANTVTQVHHPSHPPTLKELRRTIRHRLFVFKRQWLCHPFWHWLYPKPGFTRRLLSAILLLLVLGPLILFVFKPKEVSAVWFDDNYAYRQKFSFTHNADLTTPQRIAFTLNTQNLVSNGVMQSDCDDTRFTDLNGKALRFKLTGTCNAGSTTYDVVFPTVINGTNIGYVYYGNPRAITASQEVSDVAALTPNGGAPSITTRTNEEQAPSPALFLMLDEGYGSVTKDSSQNQNDGGVRGASWKTEESCVIGNCLQFDGIDDTVIATNAASVDFDTGLATASAFEAWVRPNSAGEGNAGQIFNKGSATYLKITNPANDKADLLASFDLTTDATVTVTQGIELNRWTHVAMTQNGTVINVYVNGVLKGTSTNGAGSKPADTSDLLIGGPNQAHFKGFIDEFKVYPYERTQIQINSDVSAISSLHGKSASIGPDDSFLSDGLVGYWKMDDGVGNVCAAGVDKACDSSGNGNTGTWKNGVASTSGKFGYATNYDGSNDFIQVPDANSLDMTTALTVAGWFKFDTTGARDHVIAKANSGVTAGWTLERESDNKIVLTNLQTSGGYQSTTATFTDTTRWYHIAATFNNGVIAIYVDGVSQALAGAQNVPSTLNVNANDLTIGKDTGGTAFDGQMDDVRIYNRALSPSEVGRLYDWGPGPVGWWKLDEHSGTQTFDSSGNGNTGTLTNNPQWTPGKFGSALAFDGTSNYVDAGKGASITDIRVRTVTAWIKLKSFGETSRGRIVDKRLSSGWNFVVDDAGSGDPVSGLQFTQDWSGPGSARWGVDNVLTVGPWYHVAVTYDSTSTSNEPIIYVNGIAYTPTLLSAAPSGSYTSDASSQFCIGDSCDTTRVFDGTIDDVRVYNYALAPKQIVSTMNADHPSVGSPIGSPIAYYKFDEGYDSNIIYNSGSGGSAYNGNPSGFDVPATYGSGWTDNGKFGKALNFDGSGDYIDTQNALSNFITASDATISVWLNPTGTAVSDAISYNGNGAISDTEANIGIYRTNISGTNKIWAYNWDGNEDKVGVSYNTNEWTHITLVHTGGTLYIYKNGVLGGSTASGDTANLTFNLLIGEGYTTSGNYWQGSLDEIKIYNYALSADEVKVDFNHGSALVLGSLSTDPDGKTASNSAARSYCPPGNAEGNCAATSDPAPMAHWSLDEPLTQANTSLQDISGHDNTATATNGPESRIGKFGRGVYFDVDDYLDVPTSASVKGLSAYSVSLWTYLTTDSLLGNSMYTETCGAVCTVRISMAWNANGTLLIKTRDLDSSGRVDLNSTYAPLLNAWHHIEFTFNSVNDKTILYIDGIPNDTETNVRVAVDTSTPTLIKISDTYKGLIDDVRIYPYARTASQVRWDYDRGGPVGWWKFDECSGSTAHDSASSASATLNHNDGTLSIGAAGSQTTTGNCATNASTAWYNGKDGKYNSSLNFDGNDDYVDIPKNPSLKLTGPVSVSAWINASSLADNATILDASTIYLMKVSSAANKTIRFADVVGNGCNSKNNVITANGWYHVVGVFSGVSGDTVTTTNCKIYVNGVDQTSSADGTAWAPSNFDSFWIGKGDGQFTGQIDDVRVYNYALTSAQIKTLFNENSAVRFGPITGSP